MRRSAWLLPLLLLACSDDHDHGALDPTCDEIVSRCHDLDLGPGTIHDCHQLAEGNNATMCAARRTECLAACPSVTDGGAPDAPNDGTGGGG